ncbi:MarR family winged helix-turn-helix transcriptional regulator [Candidatus Stoquefichus massiliensis]|uniref:MarR family winged helix-turn-helix transcriptional regulator n=1 Tax=Candidatus Stoquefichus massiliensis TaxID=1470350 RepID=UPI000483735A|nr:MarR family transcriptional regulator [Candidatus Stoquefichus massiliensis]
MKHEGLNRIWEELKTLHKLSTRLMVERCQNMTPEQVKLMKLIHKEKLSQKEIALKLHITEATLSVRIKRLVDSGLIEREIDSDDKRRYVIVLSSQGEDMMNEIQKAFDYSYQVICRGMTQEDYDAVLNIIKRIQNNIKEEIE